LRSVETWKDDLEESQILYYAMNHRAGLTRRNSSTRHRLSGKIPDNEKVPVDSVANAMVATSVDQPLRRRPQLPDSCAWLQRVLVDVESVNF
jgi:hypothetical protein